MMLYRGITYDHAVESELNDGRVYATNVDIYELSEIPEDRPPFGSDPNDLPIESKRVEQIVGGFTDSFGVANHFAAPAPIDPPVLVAIENGGNLGVRPIEYNIEWMHRNPGVLGHVETLASGEIRYNGKILGLADSGGVQTWGDRAEDRASSQTYVEESEYVKNAPHVDIATYVEWAVMIVNMGATGPTFEGIIKEQTEFSAMDMSYKYKDDPGAAAEFLYDLFSREIERFVGSGNFYVVTTTPRSSLHKGDDGIDPDDVAGVYSLDEPSSIHDTPIPTR